MSNNHHQHQQQQQNNNNDDDDDNNNHVIISPFAIGSDKTGSTPVDNFWRTYDNMKGRIPEEQRQQFKTRMFALSRDKPQLFAQFFSDDPADYQEAVDSLKTRLDELTKQEETEAEEEGEKKSQSALDLLSRALTIHLTNFLKLIKS